MTRLSMATVVSVLLIMLAGCGPGPAPEEQQGVAELKVKPQLLDYLTDHTDPPIIIGKGGSLWRVSNSEHGDACTTDDCCDRKYADHDHHHFVGGLSHCAKNYAAGAPVFDSSGKCIAANMDDLPKELTDRGTMWAEESTAKHRATDRKYVMTGTHNGKAITLTIQMGNAARPNEWSLSMAGGETCKLSSADAKDAVPPEFLQLDTLRLEGENSGDRFPLSFAACKWPGCQGE